MRRTIELSRLTPGRIEPGTKPVRVPSFRPLSVTLQIYDGDIERTLAHHRATGEVANEAEAERLRVRALRVWSWIENHAPDDFRYRIREAPATEPLAGEPRKVLARLVCALEASPDCREEDLVPHLKTMCEGTSLTAQDFYPYVYELLISRPKGPKLTTLLSTMGAARALPLLRAGL